MNVILLLFAAASLIGVRFSKDGFFDDYLSKEQTGMINGFFVILVFFTHFSQYIDFGSGDMIYAKLRLMSGQLVVVTFLFYSGYGMMYSILKKGQAYVSSIPTKRMIKVWYHFVLAIILFMIINLIMSKTYDAGRILLSFIGWKSIGNSNWYIFAVLCLYAFVYISFSIFKRNQLLAVCGVMVLCAVYIVALKLAGKEGYWYNTIFTYPAGMLYMLYKSKIDEPIQKNIFIYAGALAILILASAVSYKLKEHLIFYEIWAVTFMMSIVLITMKVKIGNPMLGFLGQYVFEIYILQRIPMILFKDIIGNKYIYFAVCAVITLVLAYGFKLLMTGMDGLIYNKGNNKFERK